MKRRIVIDGLAVTVTTDDPGACAGDLGGPDGVVFAGRWFGAERALDELDLHDGATLTRGRRRSLPLAVTSHRLDVIGGPNAGRSFPLARPAAMPEPDGVMGADASQLRVRPNVENDRSLVAATGPIAFNRPPRTAPWPPPAELVAPEAPKAPAASRAFGVAMIVGPVLMGAGMVVVYGNPRFGLFAALSPIVALVNVVATKRGRRSATKRNSRAHAAALARFERELDAAAGHERARREERLPDPAEVMRRATAPSVRLWERRPDHDDFLRLRAGLADQVWEPPVRVERGAAALTRVLRVVPVEIDLSNGGVVGIVGDRAAALALARSLVIQAMVHHGPADVGLCIETGADADWDWTKWLPHHVGAHATPHTVLYVVDDIAALAGRGADVRRRLRGGDGRAGGIVLAATEDQLPAVCTTIVTLTSELGAAQVRHPRTRTTIDGVVAGGVQATTAHECARRLARYQDPELDMVTAARPDVVRLLPLLGLDDIDPARIEAGWRDGGPDPAPATPIGIGADGVVLLDLVHDGPHGLIGGTTGSGKSELLRSLVAGMAARVDPDHLVFVLVDYKGGAAFDECARLPHTVGLVTDLDEQLGERALRSLEAELRHRERRLRADGASDLNDYLRAGARRGPLPRLVVVIDEFATMATELPDFLGALVGIAQRGRSLGVHLLLATQRPSGAVNANIKANTNIRIALRVQDAHDSVDIIDTDEAAAIGRETPGRAHVRRGPADVVLVQTALSTLLRRAPTARVTITPFRRVDDAPEIVLADDGPTELALLVDGIRAAFARSGLAPPRRPWLPMLDEHVTFADVERRDDVVAFALGDDPDRQRRVSVGWDPAEGHLALFGTVGSGTTTAVLAAVQALAECHSPDACHVYAVDYGAGGLAPLAALPHVGAVLGANEREGQARLLRLLRAELDARRTTGMTLPRVVTCIDGVGAFLAEHDGVEGTEVTDTFRRLFAEGPAVGIDFIVTADRVSALPLRLASSVRQRLLFRLADAADYSTIGLRAAHVPRFVPGRAVHSDTNMVVQVARPGDLTAVGAALRARWDGAGRPRPIGTLAAHVAASALPRAQLRAPRRLPIGIADADLAPAWLTVHEHDHVLIAGPPRSGKTNALALVAGAVRAADPHAVLVAVCDERSPLRARPAFDATGTAMELAPLLLTAPVDPRLWFVLVDDALFVDDPNATLAHLVRSARPGLHVIAAGRADDVRAGYGHWVRGVRQSRAGLLLQPDLAADGDLLGVRLPRRVSVPLVPGRGFVVADGEAALVQVAEADAPRRDVSPTAPRRRER